MSQLFDKIKVGTTKRSTFDLSHHQVTTSDFGYLIPICFRDMVPNDDFVVKPNVFCRLAPLAVPVYGRITCRIHHFFVPYRILYPHWDSFITQDSSNHTIPPFFTSSFIAQALSLDPQFNPGATNLPRGIYCRLMSNLGLNPDIFSDILSIGVQNISAFPFLAYYRIWMDYFADTNIYDHPTLVAAFNDIIKDGGSISRVSDFLSIRNVCYKKDYFTTAKTNPQDGSPSVVGVDIASTDLNPAISGTQTNPIRFDPSTGHVAAGSSVPSTATSKIGQFTIEALRASDALQRYKERNNFVGTKIINRILAHFGIAPTPERLDMAEFIDGSSFPIQIGDVTSSNSVSNRSSEEYDYLSTAGLGLQAGKGVGAGQGMARYHAREHGIFMSVMSILPDTAYYQGLSRMWQKGVTGDALDYFHPEFENLGYQEVLNKELFVPQSSSSYSHYDPDGVFGYVPRYSEYKFQNDILAGDFIGNVTPTSPTMGSLMDCWHLFRRLSYDDNNPLALNENFVELNNHNNDYDRIFQLSDNDFDHFYFNIDVDVKATRPMDGFTAPSLENNNSGDGNTINLPYGGTRL